ncbi:hypothetical protein [Swaminathania salitolerans]|uniref:Precorrin-3B synthase n=1 Tax=Swaminathania salitolerans TaxID=182838 RepID=A0A511BKW0_9PROT|nr:hypothetical protein [Swaminathania salitolerans]GBQ09395.1 cobalamin biosynthesis protein precorrin-3B biosynthesis protein [Swaminathania salitolerans LMG 21291]GEL00990.1 precorrin-3B synthase [Swaminathania salitolerans]
MSEFSRKKGWCPGLHAPMQSHDGWIVRITPDVTGLTPAQMTFLAEFALMEGNGQITLTQRGNIQLRGLGMEAAGSFAALAAAQGLGRANPLEEARRRIVFASPLAGLDPACAPETMALFRRLEQILTDPACRWVFPEKFSVCVDGGGYVPVGTLRADIAIQAGSAGWSIRHGVQRTEIPGGRGAIDDVCNAVQDLLAWHDAHRDAPRTLHAAPDRGSVSPLLLGAFLPGLYGGVAVMGVLEAETLHDLGRQGVAARVTPWRGLVLERDIALRHMIVAQDDPRLGLRACPGLGACSQAEAASYETARALAPYLGGRTLHVSGCAKSCAERGRSDITLVGRRGGYDLILDGDAATPPLETGLACEDVRMRLLRTDRKEPQPS